MKNILINCIIAISLLICCITGSIAQQTNSTPPIQCPVNDINIDPNTLKVSDLSSWCNSKTNSTYDPEVPPSPDIIIEKDPIKSKLDVTLLRNPVKNTLDFKITNTLQRRLNVTLTDQLGRIIFTKVIDNTFIPEYYYILNVENMQPGLYYLTVSDNISNKTKKVLKMLD